MELLKIYSIVAVSKDGHAYSVELLANPKKLKESFDKHMDSLGWLHYQYQITRFNEIKPIVSGDVYE